MGEIKFGLSGCGAIAYKHAAALNQIKEGALTAVYDPDLNRAKVLGEKYHVPYYTSYKQLLDSGIDGVSICSPSYLHAEMALEAAHRGIHLLVEKPMALTLEDADRLINTCEDKGVYLSVVLQNRFKPAVQLIRKAVDQGRFGRITHGSAVVRWNRGKDYYQNNSWRGRTDLGGGVLINQAIHNLDLLLWLMGRPYSVYGVTANQLGVSSAEDLALGIIRFTNGSMGVIETSCSIYPQNLEESLAVFGEKGTAVLQGPTADTLRTWEFADGIRDDETLDNQPFQGHLEVYKDMIRSLTKEEKPFVDGREGRKSLALIIALHRSAKERKEIVLDERGWNDGSYRG